MGEKFCRYPGREVVACSKVNDRGGSLLVPKNAIFANKAMCRERQRPRGEEVLGRCHEALMLRL